MLLLNGREVEAAAAMPALVEAVEAGFREEAEGAVVMPPRLNMAAGERGFFRIMPAVLNRSGIMGFKAFNGSVADGVRYAIAIYEQASGRMLALLDAHYLTAARTGATTAVATKYLARPESRTVGVIGSGLEARTNLLGVCTVRDIRKGRVYSPNRERRERFAAAMRRELAIELEPVERPEQCAEGADIIVVATNTTGRSDSIAWRGEWMKPGMHVNAIGSTMPRLREIDGECFARASLVVSDSIVQMEGESGDAIAAIAEGKYQRAKLAELTQVMGPIGSRRASGDITLFKSVGTAIQDVTAGYRVWQEALRLGLGREVGELFELKVF